MFAFGHVANAIGHGDDVEALIFIGDVLSIHDRKFNGNAAVLPFFKTLFSYVEHGGGIVGKHDLRWLLAIACHEAHITGAARDIEQLRFRRDGRFVDKCFEPGDVLAEA